MTFDPRHCEVPQDGVVGWFQLAMLAGSTSKRATHLADSRGNQFNIAKGTRRIGHPSSETVSQSIALSSAESISASLVFGFSCHFLLCLLFILFLKMWHPSRTRGCHQTEIVLKIQYSGDVIRS